MFCQWSFGRCRFLVFLGEVRVNSHGLLWSSSTFVWFLRICISGHWLVFRKVCHFFLVLCLRLTVFCRFRGLRFWSRIRIGLASALGTCVSHENSYRWMGVEYCLWNGWAFVCRDVLKDAKVLTWSSHRMIWKNQRGPISIPHHNSSWTVTLL